MVGDLLEAIGRRVDLAAGIRPGEIRAPVVNGGEDGGENGAASFGELAVRAAAFQYQRIPAFRRLCEARGVVPAELGAGEWRRIPAVPVEAFKTLALHADEPQEVFRSSGTLGGQARRSVHYHPYPELYRRVIDATFAPACLPSPAHLPSARSRRPLLSLVPSREEAPDSSLAFMVDRILERHGTGGTGGSDGGGADRVAFGPRGVEHDAVDAFFGARERDGRPCTVLATAFALVQWLEGSEGRFRLPAGSTIFETGGFKGKVREVRRAELLEWVEERLGVPSTSVVREYGMTELTGHLYTSVLAGGDPDLFHETPFLRVRLLDPITFDDVPEGEAGLVAFFDLANLGSAVYVVSQDLGRFEDGGRSEEGGLRLLGRASGAELRGCSLTVEELAGL